MAFDAFLKIDVLPGECTDDKHKEWIEVLSYSHGVAQSGGGSRSTAGAASSQRCDHQDFSITKNLDKTSPKLNLLCSNGQHIKEIKLALCRATEDKTQYMEYKMEDSIVSSIQVSGAGGVPVEGVTFNYGKITWTYNELDHETAASKGNVTANWSTVLNKGG